MTATTSMLAIVPLAYVVGSIPFGLLVGLARGIDPRKAGSGNIGATNVARLLGARFFALVFTLDLLKGLLPMLAALLLIRWTGANVECWPIPLLWIAAGLAAILGHMFSLFLSFKGGKGVATSAGVILGLYPYFTYPALIAIGVFLVCLAIWRYVSLGSIIGSISFPLAYLSIGLACGWNVFGAKLPLLIFAVLMALMVVWKHRGNIARIRAGTESRVGPR